MPEKRDYKEHHNRRYLFNLILFLAIIILLILPINPLRKMYFIGLSIAIIIILHALSKFESSHIKTEHFILISTLCTIAILSRYLLYFIPYFKPFLAIIILFSVYVGADLGFIIGIISIFVSNIFLGQGLWTPWQMLATGILAYISGFIFNNSRIKPNLPGLCIASFINILIIYSPIMNISSFALFAPSISIALLFVYFGTSLISDICSAVSTVFFIIIFYEPLYSALSIYSSKYINRKSE